MIKYGFLVAAMILMAQAQRPFYAGHPDRQRPQVLPQYLPAKSNSTDPTSVESRLGESDEAPKKYPYDPYNDPEFIALIKTWPVDKRPYWFINREVINQHIGLNSQKTNGNTV